MHLFMFRVTPRVTLEYIIFGWPMCKIHIVLSLKHITTVSAFHAIWLQQLERGRVTWADEEVKVDYRWAMVWHSAAGPSQRAPATSHQCKRTS